MLEATADREERVNALDPDIAGVIALDTLAIALEVLTDVQGEELWLEDHNDRVSIELSQSDWMRIVTVMAGAIITERYELPRVALDAAWIVQHLVAEMVAVKSPVPAAV